LIVNSKDDPPIDVSQYKETEFIDILQSLKFTANQFNVFRSYNVNHYHSGLGLCINPEYRGRGIATEMMKARVSIPQRLNLKISSTPFSAIGSQTAAKNAGQKESFVISYEEIEKKFPRFDFSKCHTKYFKTMDLEI
jgi:GNAT superfamily N-acetyltransferase